MRIEVILSDNPSFQLFDMINKIHGVSSITVIQRLIKILLIVNTPKIEKILNSGQYIDPEVEKYGQNLISKVLKEYGFVGDFLEIDPAIIKI